MTYDNKDSIRANMEEKQNEPWITQDNYREILLGYHIFEINIEIKRRLKERFGSAREACELALEDDSTGCTTPLGEMKRKHFREMIWYRKEGHLELALKSISDAIELQVCDLQIVSRKWGRPFSPTSNRELRARKQLRENISVYAGMKAEILRDLGWSDEARKYAKVALYGGVRDGPHNFIPMDEYQPSPAFRDIPKESMGKPLNKIVEEGKAKRQKYDGLVKNLKDILNKRD